MEKIIVVSNNELNIDYRRNLNFFSYEKVENLTELDDLSCDLLIIEGGDRDKLQEEARTMRLKSPSVPILIIVDYSRIISHEEIGKIEGYGQVRVLTLNTSISERLMEEINNLLNPSQVTTTFKIAIIVPVYNEQERFEHVKKFVVKLNNFLYETFRSSKIYFVNDGSIDDTKALVEELQREMLERSEYVSDTGFIELYDLKANTRKAGTYIEGIKSVEEDVIIFVDGDDSFYVDDIARMINLLRNGYYDIIAATKDSTAENRSFSRKGVSFFKRCLTKPLLPTGVIDAQTGLKAMKGDVARGILPYLKYTRELAIDLELLYIAKRFNYRVLQLPVRCIDRDGSHVNIVKDSISYLKNMGEILVDNRGIRRE